ncbi:MAG TPA: glycosyltransferase, partial [Acidobacteriota bacterium]|nr:glycosyltransferase [Acidobacteriota bacterium]
MAPAISVAMCLYNSMRYIDETLRSLLAQTWRDFEAILVDDGSVDGTAEHIAAWYPDPRLKIIRQANGGMGKARSVSVAHSQGEYVAFLDHDDLWMPQKLERQMAVVATHPEAVLIFSDCQLIDSNGRELGAMSERYEYSAIDLRAGYAHDELLRRGCFLAMSTAMVHLPALRKFGGPNPTLRFGDDYDMWLGLSRNHPILFIDEKLAKWRLHDSSTTSSRPEISAESHARIWGPIIDNHTYPLALRTLVADHLFGQRRCAIRELIRRRRPALALKIATEMLGKPAPLLRYLRDRASRASWIKALISSSLHSIQFALYLMFRARNFALSLPKRIRGQFRHPHGAEISGMHVWVDGTSLNS